LRRRSWSRRRENSLKAYVVNLDRAEDRLAHMHQELVRAGVEFERVAAVDGAALPADIVEDFRRYRIAAKPDGWLHGEVGCFLSHFEAWRRIADRDDAWGVVFEDDVHISPDLGPLLAESGWIPADADVVRLEANRSMRLSGGRPIGAAPGRRVYRARSGTPGAAGYILAKHAAARLTETSPELHSIPDVFLFKPKISPVASALRRYQVVPAVCIQDEVLERGGARLKSQIKTRNTRGRGYRERSNPLLKLWPIMRHAVPFRP
jgi:glycosyl transferase, family 25